MGSKENLPEPLFYLAPKKREKKKCSGSRYEEKTRHV